jgi:hypothetical protein
VQQPLLYGAMPRLALAAWQAKWIWIASCSRAQPSPVRRASNDSYPPAHHVPRPSERRSQTANAVGLWPSAGLQREGTRGSRPLSPRDQPMFESNIDTNQAFRTKARPQ